MSADAARGNYRRVLCATDFSKSSDQALQWACQFVRGLGARMDLVHVLTPDGADPHGAEGKLPEAVPPDAADLVDERHVVRAISAEVGIVHKAHDGEYDLIILGTHGRTGLRHVFLGSTAERVVNLAPCPVVTVRQGDHRFERP